MAPQPSPAEISQVIQMSVAPVFLLVGVAGFVNAFVARLSRVVDRRRHLAGLLRAPDPEREALMLEEVAILDRRARLVHIGITLSITTALLVCLTIITVFLEFFLEMAQPQLVGGFFVLAMLCLVGSLVAFLREVFLAIRSLKLSHRDTTGSRRPPADGEIP
ncbi:DUF2721 domain-containing protein [Ectothiorhodospira mobilis]|uniref:DUF2721 domain-containing protein n=1 Tax=Ectothiorhodospira mobilis TaxID=195064 RepID=A0A1I4PTB7_ECTMO|nr:DUF2721 domain-containing protein [Ectothiorhodospira mobilis]MCG5536120.1 DUF2721 domain-containing protein [Ectothiorhodospira mobilis]SFM31082.1 Protein of unknown function [Ectothiorhodospira mobilis]